MSASEPGSGGARGRGLFLAALGVVFGDIGTSPLYALRECFHGPHAVGADSSAILGVLSLIVWSLVLVISVKYVLVVMRADNRGEGGVLALLALVTGGATERTGTGRHAFLVLVGLFGAALLYGDGAITPAISVLSAAEGLEIAAPGSTPFVIPLTIGILIALFSIQRRGTSAVGAYFGPVTLVWFVCIAGLGIRSLAETPEVLAAVDPRFAVSFMAQHGMHSLLVLGGVFLAVTGGEALYADMGHFGARPIRRGWIFVVFPALLLNYFGQGALLLRSPESAVNPFYLLAPSWSVLPLVALASAATVIASQAVISGAFSMSWQAIQLGYLPRLKVLHTSEDEIGQIYMPGVNLGLFLVTVALVLGFRTSSALAGAYGIAVSATMAITSILLCRVMLGAWRWPSVIAYTVTGAFLAVDLTFLCANAAKFLDGGWFPVLLALGIVLVMTTWSTGGEWLAQSVAEQSVALDPFVKQVAAKALLVSKKTMIFLTQDPQFVPPALASLAKRIGVIPQRTIVIHVEIERIPHVPPGRRFRVEPVGGGIWRVEVRYGFLDSPNLPVVVTRLEEQGLRVDAASALYVLDRETVLPTAGPGMAVWRERLFAFLARNSRRAADYYRLPPKQVLEVGAQLEI